MALHHDFVSTSKDVRGPILKLARKGRLVDQAFKEFQRAVYPNAPDDQVAALRISFFAGATELNSMLMFGTSLDSDVTDADLKFWTHVVDEIERFHKRTIQAAKASPKKPQ
jgi:hypothetical protein